MSNWGDVNYTGGIVKELVCIECGCVTAKLSSGSSVRKGTITYCSKCYNDQFPEDEEDFCDSYNGPVNTEATLDMLKNMFGFK